MLEIRSCSLLISKDAKVTVTNYVGDAVAVDLIPVPSNSSLASAVFVAFMPAAGFSTYFLQFSAQKTNDAAPVKVCSLSVSESLLDAQQASNQSISNDYYQLTFDPETGRLSVIDNLLSGVSSNVWLP